MRMMLIAAVMGLAGCGSSGADGVVGPSATAQEQALAVVWESALDMERESRPGITWTPGCTPNRLGADTGHPECYGDTVTVAHGVELMWGNVVTLAATTKISDTAFVKGVYGWKQYLMTGNFQPWSNADLVAMSAANSDLVAAGL